MDVRDQLWSGAGPFYTDPIIRELYAVLRDGKGTHADAYQFAQRTAEISAEALKRAFGTAEGAELEGLVRELTAPVLTDGHELVNAACKQVQEALNEEAGIHIAAQDAELDEDRLSGLVHEVARRETGPEAAAKAEELGENFLMHTVDESIRANADFQHEAGLTPTIEREAEAGCCAWCSGLAGSYRYPEETQGTEVFGRHRFCRCTVTFHSDKRRQDVWSKRSWEEGREERIAAAERDKRLTSDAEKSRMEQRKASSKNTGGLLFRG